MIKTLLYVECLDGSRYRLLFEDGAPATRLIGRMRKRAEKSKRGEARAAHGALILRKVPT